MPFSIDEYKRKLHVRAAQSARRGNQASGHSDFAFAGLQKRYLDFCVDKNVNPEHKLLASLKSQAFVLKLDAFSAEELALHMEFLQKATGLHQINLSLGAATILRDVKKKFERLGLSRAPAFNKEAAEMILRSVVAACSKSPNLTRLVITGVTISPPQASHLAKAILKCGHLEIVSFANTRTGDTGLEAMATSIGKCAELLHVGLSGCNLTDSARLHIAKLISMQGTQRDATAWSSTLRGVHPSEENSSPSLMIDLSHNSLGDDTCMAISGALFHDKWVLGLNLAHNRWSPSGLTQLHETLTRSNSTLAILVLHKQAESVDAESKRVAGRIAGINRHRVRAVVRACEQSSERRLAISNILVEWGVENGIMVQVCALASTVSSETATTGNQAAEILSSRTTHHQESAIGESHAITIQFLVDRISAMEAEQQRTAAYIAQLESENSCLKRELRERPLVAPRLEEAVISQLESSIAVLAAQIDAIGDERND